MNFGYFDYKNREYVITNPKTPVKWINYLGTMDFGGIIDHTGGALLCKGDPALNRITKYLPQLPDSSFNGTTLYIRTKSGNDGYEWFSPFFTPCLSKLDKFEARVGLQYQRIVSQSGGLEIAVDIFVPISGNCELRLVNIKNISDEIIICDCIPVVEYSHFDALKQFTNADWVPQTMQSWSSKLKTKKGFQKVVFQTAFMRRGIDENYITSSANFSSFETDREVFLGRYGTWQNPQALNEEQFSNTEANRGNNIAALLIEAGNLAPGKEFKFVCQSGQHNYKKEGTSPTLYDWESAQFELNRIKLFWEDYLEKFTVDSPDENFNHMFNVHNQRQCYITYQWSRYLSLYQLGLGARGMGCRDSAQDILGILHVKPELAKRRIKELFSIQNIDGSAMHQYNPLTMEANEGDSREELDRANYYGDDHLWIVLALCWYLKESGDFDFLHERIPFYDKSESKSDSSLATIEEHCLRALEFTWNKTGFNKLPSLGFADWNDTVNLPSGAESLFIAHLFGFVLKEILELYEYLDDRQRIKKYSEMYELMKLRVLSRAWDGEWFIRYITAANDNIGSKKNSHGKIYLNAQTWAVMSGFGEESQLRQAMESANRYLFSKQGLSLTWPGYDSYNQEIGGVTTYPPGAKENGGVFCHTNPWAVIAETMLDNNERAYEYFSTINPAVKNNSIEVYEIEPYCYAQNILSGEHPQAGLGRNSWLSGVASWSFIAASRYILGIRASYNGLIFDPKFPKAWQKVEVLREFRGEQYQIKIERTGEDLKPCYAITVNGIKLEKNYLILQNAKS